MTEAGRKEPLDRPRPPTVHTSPHPVNAFFPVHPVRSPRSTGVIRTWSVGATMALALITLVAAACAPAPASSSGSVPLAPAPTRMPATAVPTSVPYAPTAVPATAPTPVPLTASRSAAPASPSVPPATTSASTAGAGVGVAAPAPSATAPRVAPTPVLAAGALKSGRAVITTASGKQVYLTLEVADTPQSMQRGLMDRLSMPEDAGMLFVFAGDQRTPFWMKDTLIPLSIAFISGDGQILEIQDMQPLTEDLHRPSYSYRYALEVNQGFFGRHGLGVGDRVEFQLGG